jgi:hypothetical protein
MTLFYWHIVLNLGLVTLLAMNISRLRVRERVGLGDGGKLALKKAIRPHANALEHVLPFSFMVFVAASLEVNEHYLLILVTVESIGQRNTFGEDISGCFEAQGLSWSLVEPTSDLVQIGLG